MTSTFRPLNRPITSPPQPGTPHWRRIVSASKIPAITGVSPWQSPYSIWHEMKGLTAAYRMDERKAAIGHLAEDMLAKAWLYDHPGWSLNAPRTLRYDYGRKVVGVTELAYQPLEDLGFPAIATIDRRAFHKEGGYSLDPDSYRILECKTAGDLRQWGTPGDPQAVPIYYRYQVQWQMGITGIHQATICAVDHQLARPEFFDLEFNELEFDMLVDAAREFWGSLRSDTPPDLDDSVATYDTVRGLHPDIDRSATVTVDSDLAAAARDAAAQLNDAKREAQYVKTSIANLMGTAYKAVDSDGHTVATRRAGRGDNPPYVILQKG